MRSKDDVAGEVTLNAPIYDAAGTQSFTFTSFKYLLDFSGFSAVQKFNMEDIEFQCNSRCSAIRLAPSGDTFVLKNCFVSRPKDRGITSIGSGCQGMLIDGCQFLSSEEDIDVSARSSIALNSNNNDVKLRHNRATRFHHFAVLGGDNNLVLGNHFFQGDSVPNGVRNAGLVMIGGYNSSSIAENYVDNCFVQWTNERDPSPDFTSGYSFSALSVTDNIFYCSNVAPWFSYFVIRPYGSGHFLNGLTVTGNKFRTNAGNIDRAERVDTTFATLNNERYVNVTFENNTFHGITTHTANPLRVRHSQNSVSTAWTVNSSGQLPFGGKARACDAVVPLGPLQNVFNATRFTFPYVDVRQGAAQDAITLRWSESVKGTVWATMRVEN